MENKQPKRKRRTKAEIEADKLKDESQDINLENIEIEKETKGLGDTIANITNFLGIKQCEPCKKRQEKLNQAFPYTKTAKEISEDDIDFINSIGTKILNEDRTRFEQLYRDTFNRKFVRCNCPTKYKGALEQLKIQIGYQNKIQPQSEDEITYENNEE